MGQPLKGKPKHGSTSGLKAKARQGLGYVLHHANPALKREDPGRYALWNIDDLEMLSRADHTRLHQKDKKANRRSGAAPLAVTRDVSCFCIRPSLLEAANGFTMTYGDSVSTLVRAGLEHFIPMAMSDDWSDLRLEIADLDAIYKKDWMQRERKEYWYMALSKEEKHALKCIETALGCHGGLKTPSAWNYSLSHLVELLLVRGMMKEGSNDRNL